MWMKYYENISEYDLNVVINIFIKSIDKFKLKAGTIYTLIDESIEQNVQNNYFSNGFKYLSKEKYKSKIEKKLKKMGIENTYDKLKMLIREL
jgi:hypothetical protein